MKIALPGPSPSVIVTPLITMDGVESSSVIVAVCSAAPQCGTNRVGEREGEGLVVFVERVTRQWHGDGLRGAARPPLD